MMRNFSANVIFGTSGKLALVSYIIAIIVRSETLKLVSLIFKSNIVISNIEIKNIPRHIAGKKHTTIVGNGSRTTRN